MGTFSVPIQVGDLIGQRFIEIEALVDTGSTCTFLPGSVLAQLGVTPEGMRTFRLADERTIQYPVGHARFRLNGDQAITLVVFAPEDAGPLLGAMTLEGLGLDVDPVNLRLIPVLPLLK